MITSFLLLIDLLLFALLSLSVTYLFVFALAALCWRQPMYPDAGCTHSCLVLFPAYQEDSVIVHSVESFLHQDYLRSFFDVVVIADQMLPATIQRLGLLPVRLLEVRFENSSKAKAMNFAMDQLGGKQYDMVVVMDADNLVDADFLSQLNKAYSGGAHAIQAHRTAKNINTDTALLDAASEEVNNAFFRKGQVRLGLSSALSGSGMAFDFAWFAENIKRVSSSGEDKELETLLLRQGIHTDYLDHVMVYDEKIQTEASFYHQRQRWLASQYASLMRSLGDVPQAIATRNIDYLNKILQWIMLPRLLLLGAIVLWGSLVFLFNSRLSIKWWCLLVWLLLTFVLAIPPKLLNKRFFKALLRLPALFMLMFLNLFRLTGANKRFNATQHQYGSNE